MNSNIMEVTIRRNGKTLFIRKNEYNPTLHIAVTSPLEVPTKVLEVPEDTKSFEDTGTMKPVVDETVGFKSEVTGKTYKTEAALKAAETKASKTS